MNSYTKIFIFTLLLTMGVGLAGARGLDRADKNELENLAGKVFVSHHQGGWGYKFKNLSEETRLELKEAFQAKDWEKVKTILAANDLKMPEKAAKMMKKGLIHKKLHKELRAEFKAALKAKDWEKIKNLMQAGDLKN